MPQTQPIKFYKMHGCGNDFVILNEIYSLSVEEIQLICNRYYGIGCDQLLMLNYDKREIELQIYNSDGSPAYSCGNGIRCIGLLMKKLYDQNECIIKVVNGNKTHTRIEAMFNKNSAVVYAELGKYNVSENDDGDIIEIGNKHLVIVIDNIQNVDMGYGEYLSRKQNTNVSFVEYSNCDAIARVYEKGVGETKACGSAAAAIHIANKNQPKETKVTFLNSCEVLSAGIRNVKDHSVAYIVGNAKLIYEGAFYRK